MAQDIHKTMFCHSNMTWEVFFEKMPPKVSSLDSSVDKTRVKIRQALRTGSNCLKFVNYADKSIIYKLNKFHYLDTNKLVVNLGVLKYLAEQFKLSNKIEHIYLDLCQIKDQGLVQFMKGNWNHLVFLDLSQNGLTMQSIESLVRPNTLGSIKHLMLNGNILGKDAASLLVKAQWKDLEELKLNFNPLGDIGINNLSGHQWTKLKELHLLGTNLTNQGLTGLVSMWIPMLHILVLGNNAITDDGCKVLARGHWKQMKTLELQGNYIKDQGLNHLTRFACYNLQSLRIFATKNYIMDTAQKISVTPTMKGLTYLTKGCWNRLKVQVTLGRDTVNKETLILQPCLKEMLSRHNVEVLLHYKSSR